ncbi:hypothetical protein F2Q68_00016051 [Brassica cretica]|uniref:Uncharacterized protein n=1 Tax=Brassica cretica TaxID=69181 RepID=A0A8S9HS83_BRACR|nr:hypothetical protein F2Q68_00016050 [Brassica cretica]KAF2559036.1 hypothetical protein F2Q68_00016051 [Brassica cretica]
MHGGNDKDSCGTVRMVRQNVEMVGKDELWYGQFGCLIVVPAETPFRTNAGRSERPDLHAELVPCTDPWTEAHHFLILQKDLSSNL